MNEREEKLRKKARMGLPLNVPIVLEDGRKLIVKRGAGLTMVARQKRPGAVLEIGEQVAMTLADRVVVVEVVRYHGKDVELQILGRRDDGPVSTTPK